MPFCPNCGNKATQEMLYCPHCGNKLAAADPGAGNSAARNQAAGPDATGTQSPIPPHVKKSKLYRQWVEHAGLPAEAAPPTTSAKRAPPPAGRNRRQDAIIYLFMATIIFILAAGLAILIAKLW